MTAKVQHTNLSPDLSHLTDSYIIGRMQESEKQLYNPQFNLDAFVGRTIAGYRRIHNPLEGDNVDIVYSFAGDTALDPAENEPERAGIRAFGMYGDTIDVLVFSDGAFLAAESWGDGECEHINYYFYNGKKTLFADQLFCQD